VKVSISQSSIARERPRRLEVNGKTDAPSKLVAVFPQRLAAARRSFS
jgi:hypothetical protein